jgi:hypothetical protein
MVKATAFFLTNTKCLAGSMRTGRCDGATPNQKRAARCSAKMDRGAAMELKRLLPTHSSNNAGAMRRSKQRKLLKARQMIPRRANSSAMRPTDHQLMGHEQRSQLRPAWMVKSAANVKTELRPGTAH